MHRCLIPLACEYQATCMCGWQLTYWICSKLTFGYSWVMLFKIEYTCFAYYHDKMITSVFKKMRWLEHVSIISCRWMSESYNVWVFVSYIFSVHPLDKCPSSFYLFPPHVESARILGLVSMLDIYIHMKLWVCMWYRNFVLNNKSVSLCV